ncbi:MAG: hypothetical protein NT099_05620 [Candidatus Saganbacteria bacterium]|nr:hypothetical protein [Candidatus Saganbacteria bacterium]
MTKLKGESTASLVNSIVPEKEEVAGIRIKVDNKVFQLDGKNKIAIAVEAKSGLKVKLSLDEKELGGERGGLTIINEVVNADGLANFVYLPPLLAASFEAYKYVYISANVSVPGKAGVLKDAQRMTLAVQKETVVVLDKERKEMTDHYYDELMKDLADLDKKGIKTADFRQIAKTNKLQLLKSQSSEEAMGCSDNIHLMALECRYLKVLYDRQMETNKWFTESLKSGISTLSDLIGVTDKLEAATKARIKKEYSKVPYDNFKKELLATFIENLYTQFEKASDSLKATGYSPEDLKAFKKLGMEYLNEKSIDTFSEFIFSYFKESTIKETQANLDLFVGGIKNRTGVYNADKKVNPSLDLYSTYEKEHNLLNMAHLDRELYRLDTKLLLDTVIKGPLVYFNMKNMVADKKFATKLKNLDADSLSKIYKEFTESPTFLKNISGGIDGMFYSYCGYNWLIDYYKINKIRTDLTALLLK